ncbi:DnaD domain-containing protein [Macrococcoides caseolyticum]|uniref:DnaD domain-containing protein n=1 Tax=Macrococcoides caseolyticum TaxID=69966 RepID=UPI000C31F3B7|nr:DnaD domain protein [Macrococcus caseolyticus]PKE48837.1 DNA replication protein DnaD [Macrococcus caseolyticus]PKF15801.1 DNA replication protein DnaD [Macrococcus caseolyticus]
MSNKIGWVSVHRKLLDKPIWKQSTPEQKTILITLLLMADHDGNEWEFEGKKYKTAPGQFVTSLPSIVEECGKGISIQNVRTALKRFEKLEFLTDKSTKVNRLITINNWGLYQDTKKKANSEVNSHLTDNQQSANSHLTSNNNVIMQQRNNDNNVVVVTEQNNDFAEVIQLYQSDIQATPPHTVINKLSDDFDMFGKDIMLYAIKKSALAGNRDYRFIDYLTKDWRKQQLKTLEAVEQYEDKRNQPKQSNKYSNDRNAVTNKYADRPDLSFQALEIKKGKGGLASFTDEERKAYESYYL